MEEERKLQGGALQSTLSESPALKPAFALQITKEENGKECICE